MLGATQKVSRAMQRGIDHEDEVRRLAEGVFSRKFEPLVALADDRPWQMASLDGLSEDGKTILEIKVVGERTFGRALSGEHITEYAWQIQHQMAVFETAEEAFLLFAKPNKASGFEICTQVAKRFEPMIHELNAKEFDFYRNHMLGFNCPDL